MKKSLIVLGLILTAIVPALASAASVGVAARGNSTILNSGIGAEVTLSPWERVDFRLGLGNYSDSTYTSSEGGINYSLASKLKASSLLLDWYPFAGTFRLSAGLVKTDFTITGTASGPVTVGPTTTTATVSSEVKWPSSGTYFGLGWGDAPARGTGFVWAIDAGVIMMGSPSARITLANVAGTTPSAADIAQEERELTDALSPFKALPLFGLSLGWRF